MHNQLPAHLVMLHAPLHPEGLEPHTRLEDEPFDGAVLQLQQQQAPGVQFAVTLMQSTVS
jgi:folate-dependent tRNA-U54 methylase TrmFO/GidA